MKSYSFRRVRQPLGNRALYLALAAITFLVLIPFFWCVVTSFKPEREVFSWPPRLIAKEGPSFQAWKSMLSNPRTGTSLRNSVFLATVATVVSVSASAVSAYGMSRFDYPGKQALRIGILVTQMVPGVFILVPYYSIMQATGLYDTYLGLLIGFCSFSVPFGTMMLHGFFNSVPVDLDEAALMDGCTWLQALFRVVLPVSLPGIMGTAIFSFLGVWGNLLFVAVMTRSQELWTITLHLASQIREYDTLETNIMVLAIISSVPLIVGWIIGQRWVVKGMMSGMIR